MGTDPALDLQTLEREAQRQLAEATDLAALDQVRVHYLGKSGLLTSQLKQLGALPKDCLLYTSDAADED